MTTEALLDCKLPTNMTRSEVIKLQVKEKKRVQWPTFRSSVSGAEITGMSASNKSRHDNLLYFNWGVSGCVGSRSKKKTCGCKVILKRE